MNTKERTEYVTCPHCRTAVKSGIAFHILENSDLCVLDPKRTRYAGISQERIDAFQEEQRIVDTRLRSFQEVVTDAWAEAQFSPEDRMLLLEDQETINTMLMTSLTESVVAECQRDLERAKKYGEIK